MPTHMTIRNHVVIIPDHLRTRRFQDLVDSYEPISPGSYRARNFIEDDDNIPPAFMIPDGSPRELRFD